MLYGRGALLYISQLESISGSKKKQKPAIIALITQFNKLFVQNVALFYETYPHSSVDKNNA